MSYSVKEIFYSLQGEGARAGRPAVFCRFAGCNLWSGEEKHRVDAECNFCDTDIVGTDGVGGGKFKNAQALSENIAGYWSANGEGVPYVVFTGGEPLLQLDEALIQNMHQLKFEIAVETNGTLLAPAGIDWLCVSPKGRTVLKQKTGNELKFVHPQTDIGPDKFSDLEFEQFYLQPLEEQGKSNIETCVNYCLEHPQWQLSLQTHKLLGIR
jgi:7-carboxy-7-deazaguanine synthase (Cx14CxxC type)